MRRLLSFILFLCVTIGVYAQTDYGLTVGGTAVNSSNRNDVMGDGTVSYDPTTHTLKLKDASIDGYATGSAIKANSRIVIDLDGNSTLYAPTCMENSYSAASESDFGTTITSSSGNGTLKMVGSYGIMTTNGGGLYIHDCTVNTDCISTSFFGDTEGKNKTLKIERAKADLNGSSNTPCIFGYEKLVFDGSKVIEPSGAYYEYDGFGAMYKSDGTFCVNMKIGLDEATDYGISGATLNDVAFSVNSENYADVLGDGTLSYNPEQNTLTMNGTHLYGLIVFDLCKPDLRINIVGTQNSIEGYCMINTSCTLVGNNTKKAVTSQLNVNSIGLASSLTIQNLAVEFIGSKLGFQSQSGTASLTLRNATVNANGAEGVFKSIPSLVLEDCEILTPEGAYYDAEKKYIVDESGNRVTGVVTIGPKVEPVVEYYIKIGDMMITSENCADVLGDGTLSYDPETNVLLLNNLQAAEKSLYIGSSSYDHSFETMKAMNNGLAGIKVKVTGDNALESLWFYGGVDGTLCGDGTLVLEEPNMTGSAISSLDNLLIEDCNLVLTAPDGNGIYMWYGLGWGCPGKLTIRNASLRINARIECIGDFSSLVLESCYVYSPAGAHYDKEKHAIVDKDGKIVYVTGNLIIRKGAPQFPGSGTEDDPFILSEGTNTFTTPVGEAYYKYTATEDCVMQIEVKEESGVTGDIYNEKDFCYRDESKLESREVLVRKGVSKILWIVSTDPDNEVSVKFREPGEGEIEYKAIPLNEGDNPIPAIDANKKPVLWYKLLIPAGTSAVCTFTDEVNWYIDESRNYILCGVKDIDIRAMTISHVTFFTVYYMPEGGNANVKLEGPVTPEKGTGTKDDPFVLDGILPPPSPVPGTGEGDPGKPGTGPGGTGTGSYTNPPTIIAPPAGTSSCYTFTATDDCVLGLAVSVGNEFEGKLIINGVDAGNIDDREVLLRKGNVVMLDIVNAGKDDLVAVNLREPGEGEIWYKAILLDEGTHTIPAIISSKNVALWYKVVVPDMRNISLTTSSIGDMAVFAEDNADSEVEGSMVTAGDEGLEYSHDNTTGSDEPLYFKVSDMASGCTATVVFSEELGIIEVTADGTVTAPAYNVSGQRVGNGYKGVTIMNGKKFVRR